jgi:hypothetical protein
VILLRATPPHNAATLPSPNKYVILKQIHVVILSYDDKQGKEILAYYEYCILGIQFVKIF